MVIGSMLDAGLPFSHLKRELGKLKLKGYNISRAVEGRGLIGGINFNVNVDPDERHHRHYKNIASLISKSALKKSIKDVSLSIFDIIARAEARVHRIPVDKVHFHEVGGIDSIVDIVGAAIGLDYFKFKKIYASPLPMTKGWVKCEHGKLPVPAPATLEILKGLPLMHLPIKGEIVTPTGAAIMKTIVKEFCDNPIWKIRKIGYGHGDRKFKNHPNSLRLIVGEGKPAA